MLIVMLIITLVDILLLFAAGRFVGSRGTHLRIFLGAIFDGVVTSCSLLPGYAVLGNFLCRLCSLVIAGIVSYGFTKQTLPKLLLFSLFSLSLGSVAGSRNQLLGMFLGAVGIGFACLIAGKGSKLIPIQLTFQGKTIHLMALLDTGNDLRDPVTGRPVLVVDADIAKKLTGLAPEELREPLRTLQQIPGLRLIPYKTVGNHGFLLAVSIPQVKIGNSQGSTLVALSPNLFAHHYQALTGGMV